MVRYSLRAGINAFDTGQPLLSPSLPPSLPLSLSPLPVLALPLLVVSSSGLGQAELRSVAPFYHPSEIILGRALAQLKDEYPRSSYTLITKVGKYGEKVGDHVYDPETIRASVQRSLRRLGTDYLDVVCA